MAFELATLVVAFLYIGRWVDSQYGWNGIGIAAGAFTGLGLWVTHLVMVMNRAAKIEAENEAKEREL